MPGRFLGKREGVEQQSLLQMRRPVSLRSVLAHTDQGRLAPRPAGWTQREIGRAKRSNLTICHQDISQCSAELLNAGSVESDAHARCREHEKFASHDSANESKSTIIYFRRETVSMRVKVNKLSHRKYKEEPKLDVRTLSHCSLSCDLMR